MAESLPSIDEDARRRFERAWHEGQPLPIEKVFPPSDAGHYLATLAELVHVEMEFAWKAWGHQTRIGQGPFSRPARIEDYLKRFPGLGRADLLRELLEQEYLLRQRYGDKPSAEEYRAHFPTLTLAGLSELPARATLPGPPAVPGYEILEVLGQGGMGVVYKARQLGLGRMVAIKMILGARHAGAEERARFRTEAEAVARLQHPNIVSVFEVGELPPEEGRLPFLALEFCPGGSLARRLNGTPLPPLEAANLTAAVARATHAAHAAHVAHRDLKPDNVLLAADGTPKITDFGLARKLDEPGRTQSGAVIGTPSYMAPEQARGNAAEAGPPEDVYALGAILYECLTGRPPFRAATALETLAQVVSQEPVPPRRLNAGVPRDLETVCLKCLSKEPARRYATAQDLADDLQRFQAGEPVRARPVGRPERAWKWARRRPAVAGLLAGIVTLTLLALGIITGLYRNALDKAEDARKAEERAEKDRKDAREQEGLARLAETNKSRELERAEWMLYASQLQSAQREWEAGRADLAWKYLDSCRWDFRGIEHRYLYTLFSRNQVTLEGHLSGVWSVAVSADGKRIVSGGDTSRENGSSAEVKVWDAATGQCLLTLLGHSSTVAAVAVSADGKRIASASWDATVKLWDGDTGQCLRTLRRPRWWTRSVALSPDCQRIYVGSEDGITVWDASTGKELFTFKGHGNAEVRPTKGSLAVSTDGRRIVSSQGGTVKVWDSGGKELLTLSAHPQNIQGAALSPDGKRIVLVCPDVMKMCDAVTGECLLTFQVRESRSGGLNSVAFSADGKRVVTGSYERKVQVWDAATGKELFTLMGHAHFVEAVCFGPDGKSIISGSRDRTLKVWEVAGGQEVLTLRRERGYVAGVALSPDGRRVASGCRPSPKGEDHTVKVWDAVTGKGLLTLAGHADQVNSVCFSPDGKRIVSGSGKMFKRTPPAEAKVWDAHTGQCLLTLSGHSDAIAGVALSHDGTRVVTGSADRTVKVWDAADGRCLLTLTGHSNGVLCVAVSPDGKRIVSGSSWYKARDATSDGPGELKVWDARDGRCLLNLTGHTGSVSGVAFSPDARRLASTSWGVEARGKNIPGEAKVWEVETGRELLNLAGHADHVNSVCFSKDGKRLLTSSSDQTVKVWEATTGRELLTLKGHVGPTYSVGISQDGSRIAAGGNETVTVWEATAGQQRLFLEGPSAPLGSVALSGDSTQVFGQDEKGKVHAWNASTGQILPEAPASMPPGGHEARNADGSLQATIEGNLIRISRPDLVAAQEEREGRTRERLRRLADPDPEWHRQQFRESLDSGNDFAASFHAGRLLRHEPWDSSLHLYQAHLLARLGRREESAAHLMHALFLNRRASLGPVDPEAGARGEKAAEAGDWPQALQAFELATHQPEPSIRQKVNLLYARVMAGDQAGARESLPGLIELLKHEKTGPARDWLVNAALWRPLPGPAANVLAKETLQDAQRQGNATNLHRLGAALYRAGQFTLAERLLADAVKAQGKGGFADTWLFQALTAHRLGKSEEAVRLLARFEEWHGKQKEPPWRERVYFGVLLAEARKLIRSPPPMSKLGPGE